MSKEKKKSFFHRNSFRLILKWAYIDGEMSNYVANTVLNIECESFAFIDATSKLNPRWTFNLIHVSHLQSRRRGHIEQREFVLF